MSRTLFWYIFADLLYIFSLTSGALSGIMSFGGLLRPLTENGLNVSQVGQILADFMPAMTAYSMPVAALFATTMVYGRLSADNEVTACRSMGISYLSLTTPAVVLGFVTCMASLFLLCFIVPRFTLHVEHVVYSNLAQLTANRIEKTHHISFGPNSFSIFADGAEVVPPPADQPGAQIVRLYGPMIMTMERPDKIDKNKPVKPDQFSMARTATAYITQDDAEGEVRFFATMDNGMNFEREQRNKTGMQASVKLSTFSPPPTDSPIRENTKFKDIRELQQMLKSPEKSRRISSVLKGFVEADQKDQFLKRISNALLSRNRAYRFDTGKEVYELSQNGDLRPEVADEKLTIGNPQSDGPKQLRFRIVGDKSSALDATAREIRVTAWPVQTEKRMTVDIELVDALVLAQGDTEPAIRGRYTVQISVPMTPDIQEIASTHTASYYANESHLLADQRIKLKRDLVRLSNSIQSELHARASFALSCFILVLVGAALGMMFRSGNFLSAFAVSVVPALLSIVLIVTGQHTCENVAQNIGPNFVNPLRMGLALIWSGNAAVLVIGAILLGKLQRT